MLFKEESQEIHSESAGVKVSSRVWRSLSNRSTPPEQCTEKCAQLWSTWGL